jgi:hypothetical protein
MSDQDKQCKSTPGPWSVSSDVDHVGCVIIDAPDHRAIIEVVVKMEDEDEPRPELLGNLSLVLASQDMLKALELAEKWLEGWASADYELFMIRAAIAKAKGE